MSNLMLITIMILLCLHGLLIKYQNQTHQMITNIANITFILMGTIKLSIYPIFRLVFYIGDIKQRKISQKKQKQYQQQLINYIKQVNLYKLEIQHSQEYIIKCKEFQQMKNKYCTICSTKQEIVDLKLKCGHYYHLKCLEFWLKFQWSCPYCTEKIEPFVQRFVYIQTQNQVKVENQVGEKTNDIQPMESQAK